MNEDDRSEIIATLIRTLAMAAIVVLADPGLRFDLKMAFIRLVSKIQAVYDGPSPAEISALHQEARAILGGTDATTDASRPPEDTRPAGSKDRNRPAPRPGWSRGQERRDDLGGHAEA